MHVSWPTSKAHHARGPLAVDALQRTRSVLIPPRLGFASHRSAARVRLPAPRRLARQRHRRRTSPPSTPQTRAPPHGRTDRRSAGASPSTACGSDWLLYLALSSCVVLVPYGVPCSNCARRINRIVYNLVILG